MHSCVNTDLKGWSWPNFWANLAFFLTCNRETVCRSLASASRACDSSASVEAVPAESVIRESLCHAADPNVENTAAGV